MSQVFKRLIPTFNRILVKRFEVQTKTASGIILSKTEDNNQMGEVVEIGPGNYDNNGKRIPMAVAKGDKVLLPEFGGQEVTLNKEKLFVFRDSDIIGKLE